MWYLKKTQHCDEGETKSAAERLSSDAAAGWVKVEV